jgi:hypothetical protein
MESITEFYVFSMMSTTITLMNCPHKNIRKPRLFRKVHAHYGFLPWLLLHYVGSFWQIELMLLPLFVLEPTGPWFIRNSPF